MFPRVTLHRLVICLGLPALWVLLLPPEAVFPAAMVSGFICGCVFAIEGGR